MSLRVHVGPDFAHGVLCAVSFKDGTSMPVYAVLSNACPAGRKRAQCTHLVPLRYSIRTDPADHFATLACVGREQERVRAERSGKAAHR